MGLDWRKNVSEPRAAHSMSWGQPNPASTFAASFARCFICLLSKVREIDFSSERVCSVTVPFSSSRLMIFLFDIFS